jgi:uncharacterized membrane protein YdbT with pleckstrin-like domain
MENDEVLLQRNPKMFRNNPIGFSFSLLLVPVVGLGLGILFIWWLRTKMKTLIVTTNKTRIREGILSKKTDEVMHDNVRNIQVEQGVFQRMLGTGKVQISSAGQSGVELTMSGIMNPEEVRDLINKHR